MPNEPHHAAGPRVFAGIAFSGACAAGRSRGDSHAALRAHRLRRRVVVRQRASRQRRRAQRPRTRRPAVRRRRWRRRRRHGVLGEPATGDASAREPRRPPRRRRRRVLGHAGGRPRHCRTHRRSGAAAGRGDGGPVYAHQCLRVPLADRVGGRLPRVPVQRGRRRRGSGADVRRHLRIPRRTTAAGRLARRPGTHGGQRRGRARQRHLRRDRAGRSAARVQRRRPQIHRARGMAAAARAAVCAAAAMRRPRRAGARQRQHRRCDGAAGQARSTRGAPRAMAARARSHRQDPTMNSADIERVFGRDRLKMMTGEHVEVFREASLPGERRRYTKRFLSTTEGDFRHWTEREWRILARLVGHRIGPVPDVVQFDRGSSDRPALVQTYDAGITVDHWATLLPVERDGRVLRHVFEDCAHWWALAQHCLVALDAIHELHLVHLDLKADNVCIPLGPPDFDPYAADQPLRPLFGQIALIDFAFSLVSGESLVTALPIGHEAGYHYQSPRLVRALEAGRQGDLQPTRELDWRCDIFSLAAMLDRYLPALPVGVCGGWSGPRREQAQVLVDRLFDIHHGLLPATRPHRALIALTEQALNDRALVASLARGWMLALDADMTPVNTPTPVTRIAVPVPATLGPMAPYPPPYAVPRRGTLRWPWLAAAVAAGALGAPLLGDAWHAWRQGDEEPVAAQSSRDVMPVMPGVAARDAAAVPAMNAAKPAAPAVAVVSAAASDATAASSPAAQGQGAAAGPAALAAAASDAGTWAGGDVRRGAAS